MQRLFAFIAAAGTLSLSAGDWPQWGGSDARTFSSDETGLPAEFRPAKIIYANGQRTTNPALNVRWTAPLGMQTYGNPTVTGGRVFVGSNDARLQDKRIKRTGGGLLMCLAESDGRLLWQLPIPRMRSRNKRFNFDHMGLGLCSSPAVDGERVYITSSRGEILCLDVHGQANGNDGPYTNEGVYMAFNATLPDKPGRFDWSTVPLPDPIPLQPTDADIIWRYDMLTELDVWPQDAVDCSIVVHGDRIYVATSNGRDEDWNIPSPTAPDIIVLDKHTGALLAVNEGPVGTNIFHGEWSSPTIANVHGRELLIWGGGDGFCYAFDTAIAPDPAGGPGLLKRVWWFDCNPPHNKWRDGQPLPYNRNYEGPSEIIATPAFYRNKVYVGVGQDSRHGVGPGCFSCIDATATGAISAAVWQSFDVGRAFSSAAIGAGLVFVADYAGIVRCFDAETGAEYWSHDLNAHVFGTALVADGKVYIGDEAGVVTIFACAREKRVLNRVKLDTTIYTTPVAANATIFIASQRTLYAIADARAERGDSTALQTAVDDMVHRAGLHGGVVAVLGGGDGSLPAALGRHSNLVVHVLERDAAAVDRLRARLRERGLYGRVAVERLRGARLPYADNIVNLLLVADAADGVADAELLRVLTPGGAVLSDVSNRWHTTLAKPWPTDDDAVPRDDTNAPCRRLQWIAMPRWGRDCAAPSSVLGLAADRARLLYVIDEGPCGIIDEEFPDRRTLIARDAYNGALLWRRSLAEIENAPGDAAATSPFMAGHSDARGILSARDERVFVAAGGGAGVAMLDAATGVTVGHRADADDAAGSISANGLVYVPPYPGRSTETAVFGFHALADGACAQHADPPEARLEKGPAYDDARIPENAPDAVAEWPMYRHDIQRSGATTSTIPGYVELYWVAELDGRITAPVVAGGRVYVGLCDQYGIACLDAETGNEIWTASCGGRVDSPPTVHGGRIIFGSADGWVYCLRARDGALIWRFQAAPCERLIGGNDRLESAWPVHGSVLVLNNCVYALAGRAAGLDGGLELYALDAATGLPRHHAAIHTAPSRRSDLADAEAAGLHLDAALSDLLVSDGTSIWVRQLRFNTALVRQAPNDKTAMGDMMVGQHVMATSELLDGEGFNRTMWVNWQRWPGRHFFCDAPKSGQLLVFNDRATFAAQAFAGAEAHRHHAFLLGQEGYQIVADSNDNEPVLASAAAGVSATNQVRAHPPLWNRWVDVMVKAMLITGDRLLMIGPTHVRDPRDPLSAIEGRRNVRMLGLLMQSGRTVMGYAVDELPVWDGMAVAYGKVYIATQNGRVICLARNVHNL